MAKMQPVEFFEFREGDRSEMLLSLSSNQVSCFKAMRGDISEMLLP